MSVAPALGLRFGADLVSLGAVATEPVTRSSPPEDPTPGLMLFGWSWHRVAPVLLAVLVLLLYLPSLAGGFSSYDDNWLIRDNPLLQAESPAALGRFWFDFSKETRMVLGAEYLPVRDTSHWLEIRLFGLHPTGMRAVSLALYVATVLILRAGLLRLLPERTALAEVAAWVFAVHPVHVESVAWLAGRKDVLALLFVALAVWAYAKNEKSRAWTVWLVPLWVLLATLSKSMSVIAPGLLLACDVLASRRPKAFVVIASFAAAFAAFGVHWWVGGQVDMVQPPVGGSRWAAMWTMGPIWLRYVFILLWPPGLSIVQPLSVLAAPTAGSVLGWAALLGAGLWAAKRVLVDKRGGVGPAAYIWFVLPLVPVSQVLVPLQNVMADRYAWLSVMTVGLVMGWLYERVQGRQALSMLVLLPIAGFGFSALERGSLFADDVALFSDAMAKAPDSAVPGYQLGILAERALQLEPAISHYQAALGCAGPAEARRRSVNNLARSLVKLGRLSEARAVLEKGRLEFPDDPKMLSNLMLVRAKMGDFAGAETLKRELDRRFPNYRSRRPRPGH